MAYLAIAIFFGFVILLHKVIDGADERNEREIEALHAEAYALVDKYYGDSPNLAKARKTEIDAMVHEAFENVNRSYETKTLKEVSTAKERKKYKTRDGYAEFDAERARIMDAIDEAQMASFTEEDLRPYIKVSREEGIERVARETVKMLGISYEEAYRRAVKNYNAV